MDIKNENATLGTKIKCKVLKFFNRYSDGEDVSIQEKKR